MNFQNRLFKKILSLMQSDWTQTEPDLSPNCLQRLSADVSSRQTVILTAADHKFCDIFLDFSENKVVPWVGLQCVIAAFSSHTHLLFENSCKLSAEMSSFGLLKKGFVNAAVFVFVWVDALRHSQHFFQSCQDVS